jgi:hypothetical protein
VFLPNQRLRVPGWELPFFLFSSLALPPPFIDAEKEARRNTMALSAPPAGSEIRGRSILIAFFFSWQKRFGLLGERGSCCLAAESAFYVMPLHTHRSKETQKGGECWREGAWRFRVRESKERETRKKKELSKKKRKRKDERAEEREHKVPTVEFGYVEGRSTGPSLPIHRHASIAEERKGQLRNRAQRVPPNLNGDQI